MSDTTRRGFISVAGIGAAVGVAAAVVPGSVKAVESDNLPADVSGSMSAYIHDLHAGEVALQIEGAEVIVTDKKLAARMAQAFSRARRG